MHIVLAMTWFYSGWLGLQEISWGCLQSSHDGIFGCLQIQNVKNSQL